MDARQPIPVGTVVEWCRHCCRGAVCEFVIGVYMHAIYISIHSRDHGRNRFRHVIPNKCFAPCPSTNAQGNYN